MPRKPRRDQRISDTERFEVAGRLREAAAEGRLEAHELDERIQAAYAAKTYGELRGLTRDLPRPRRQRQPVLRPEAGEPVVAAAVPRHDRSVAVMGSEARKHVWEVGAEHDASAVLGSVTLDLRQAQFTAPVTVIRASAYLGSLEILVNPWTQVEVDGTAVAGSFTEVRSRVRSEVVIGSPVVRVQGHALMGTVKVHRRPLPGTRRRRWLGRLR